MQPATAIGTIERGTVIPGVGTVSAVRSLVGIADRIFGKHHTDSAVFLIDTVENRRFKLITFAERRRVTAGNRTRESSERLNRFSCDGCVPRAYYVDDRSLVVGFIPGRVLTEARFTEQNARELGMFIAGNQASDVRASEVVAPDTDRMIDKLRQGPRPDEEFLDSLQSTFRGMSGFKDCPRALCFFDSALKNYVCSESGGLAYVDVFGIAPRLVGSALVRQALTIPVPLRESFLHAYLDASEHAFAIMDRLPDYCLQHLLYRAAHQLDLPGSGKKRTFARTKKRRLAYRSAMDSLQACYDLPRTVDGFRNWLLTVYA